MVAAEAPCRNGGACEMVWAPPPPPIVEAVLVDDTVDVPPVSRGLQLQSLWRIPTAAVSQGTDVS